MTTPIAPQAETGRCETCRFWGQERVHDHDMPLGSCRVAAPVVSDRRVHLSSDPLAHPKPHWPYRGCWPWVAFDDWCGAHQKREA